MQLGFVIDQSRCIGCHACTIACKSENDVPLGDFRTWVKYTETGEFPEVRRSFTVLRCNQCTDAPCVTICPVTALDKRPDGIVDVDHRICIGCKACMQGCPYDALYLNEQTGTAQKCHFCAHRTEIGLAPACAIVCPTEAIIPGDFHDPESAVSRMRAAENLLARKTEAGTGPNVFYKEAHPSGIDPLATNRAGGYLWAQQTPSIQLEAHQYEAAEKKAGSRTVYDVDHKPMWGPKVSAYLFTKSLSAGAFLAGSVLLSPLSGGEGLTGLKAAFVPALALLFLLITTGLLIGDLKRPDRFLLILKRPNWNSWVAKGSIILTAYGALLSIWLAAIVGLGGDISESVGDFVAGGLMVVTAVCAALTACYTAWLFGQAKGRVLWLKRGLWLHLILQAGVAGGALILLLSPVLDLSPSSVGVLRYGLIGGLLGHLVMTLIEGTLAPHRREREYKRTVALITHGPFARLHWGIGVGLGVLVPIVLLAAVDSPIVLVLASVLGLIGLFVEEDILVRAGQALPIS